MSECGRCALYRELRGPRIKAEIAKTSKGAEARLRFAKFMDDYHAAHVTAGRYVALLAMLAGDDGSETTPSDGGPS